MSSIPFVVKITFAPALRSFSIRSFVMSASLQDKSSINHYILHRKHWISKPALNMLNKYKNMRKQHGSKHRFWGNRHTHLLDLKYVLIFLIQIKRLARRRFKCTSNKDMKRSNIEYININCLLTTYSSWRMNRTKYLWRIFSNSLGSETKTWTPICIFAFWRLKSRQAILAGATLNGIPCAARPVFRAYPLSK